MLASADGREAAAPVLKHFQQESRERFNSRKPYKHVRSPSSCEWAELLSGNTLRNPLHKHRQAEAIEKGGADHHQPKHASTPLPFRGRRSPPSASIYPSINLCDSSSCLSKNKKDFCLTLIGFLLTNQLVDNSDIRKLLLKKGAGPRISVSDRVKLNLNKFK